MHTKQKPITTFIGRVIMPSLVDIIARALLGIVIFSPCLIAQSLPAEKSCTVEDHIRVCHDLNYGPGGPGHLLDVYVPNPPPLHGHAVLTIHGGCFTSGDKQDMASNARVLAKAGFIAVAPNYTLAKPGATSYPKSVRRSLRAAPLA